MLAIVTGIPGTGKTTIATRALDELSEEGVEYERVTYGTVMSEIAKEEGLVSNRDEMRKLDPKTQRRIQEKAAEKIRENAKDGNILIDTHCTISTPEGYLPGLPENVLRLLKPDTIILVESDPEEINVRRDGDKTRKRDDEGLYEIRLHQDTNRNFAAAYAVISGATVEVIRNPQGDVEKAVKEMKNILR